ncbi:MAG: NADH-quinone oxidoreductase subunit N [Thaumarchaeota archaeon]|nr:NADH-quinone oxidoreductase subunit N [Nitrososphaerota archaeon]
MDYVSLTVILMSVSSLLLPIFLFDPKRREREPAYFLGVVLAASLLMIGINTIYPAPGTIFGSLLASDRLGGIFALTTLFVTLIVVIVSTYTKRGPNTPAYYSLLSFTALGMVLLSYSQDLLIIFVAWELMSLPTYVLAGFNKRSMESNEASVKYAVIGAMSSAIILYAISLTYGLTGTTQISAVVQALSTQPLTLATSVAVLLFVTGFGFKMSIVPFHMWIPDAYEGAPIIVSTLLAAATKKAGFVSAIRVLLAISTFYVLTQNPIFTLPNVFAGLALVTMTLGNLAALTQKSMTRLLAYSSIAQAGYILIGFVIYSYGIQNSAFLREASLGITGALFHIVNHAIMKGVAFLAAGLVLLQLHRGDVQAYDGLSRRMPFTAITLSVAFLALAGVPPLSGFWSKLLLFLSVINGPFAWLAVAGVLNSAFSLGYYAWIIKRMYLDEPETAEKVNEPYTYLVIFAVSIGLIIGFGVFPDGIINFLSGAFTNIAPH